MQGLETHWAATHTVSMVETFLDPWGERPPRRIQHYTEIPDSNVAETAKGLGT